MSEIRILDAQVANQIAAGEVVERPASVVKELVENAIDAGATFIQVEADEGGRFLRVVDNGAGIKAESLELAFQRFATSKLSKYSDIWSLNSMGFRGEALPSIASVSKLEVLSRTADREIAHKLILEGGYLQTSSAAGGPVGTSLTLRDLFYNTPARLKFMSRESTEYTHIQQLMQAFALDFPQIAFSWIKRNKVVFSTSGQSDLMGVVRQLFGKEMAASLFSVRHEYRGAELEAALSYPDSVRKDRNYQFFFINQRWVKVPALNRVLDDLYSDMIPKRHHPVAILKLQLPADSIDINVHPTKREVKFKNFSLVYQLLKEALEQALNRYDLQRTHLVETPKPQSLLPTQTLERNTSSHAGFHSSEQEEPPPFLNSPFARPFEGQPFAPTPSASSLPGSAPQASDWGNEPLSESQLSDSPALPPWQQSSRSVQAAEPLIAYQTGQPDLSFSKPLSAPQIMELPGLETPPVTTQEQEQAILHTIRPVGQVCENTYIVGHFGRDLVLIDQHVAEERYLYEKVLAAGEIVKQPLLISVVLDLNEAERELIDLHSAIFEQAGIEFEAYGPTSIAIRTLPQCLKFSEAEVTVRQLLEDMALMDTADPLITPFKLVCKTIACHSAIRAGDPLSLEQMQQMIKNWAATRYPYTCPHGRPVLLKLSKSEINRRFLRTWS